MEIFDSKTGESFQLIFDDMKEEQIAREIVNCLINGVPKRRIVAEIPDFLKKRK